MKVKNLKLNQTITNLTFTDSTYTWVCDGTNILNDDDQIYFTRAGDRPYVGSTIGHPQTFFLYHTYYVVNSRSNSFQLSLTRGGSKIKGNGSDSSVSWDAKKVMIIEIQVFLSGGSFKKIAPRIADSIGAVAIITRVFATFVF